MLNSGADTGVQNTAKMTALHKAILYKHEDVIEMLFEAGAPLNIKGGKFKRTPLHLAVDLENMELVKLLLRKHASLTVKDHRGHYPIHIAAIRGNVEILRELYAADRTQDKLRISSYGTKSVIKGMSLFHVAVWKKNEELLNALIDLRADPNVQDFYGQTPLFFAIMKKQEDCIRKLLEYERTNKRKPQKQGFTPLHAAIHKNLDEIAKQLARYSDVNARDKYGRTPLHAACEKAKLQLIRTLLVQYGADPRIITKRGDTVYHILRRSKKKLSENEVDNSQQAEQLISEFDPEFAKQLPNLRNKAGVVIKVRTTRQPPDSIRKLLNIIAQAAPVDYDFGGEDFESVHDDYDDGDMYDDNDFLQDMYEDYDDGYEPDDFY
ncbi:serine/threonine-protein phosphatase 6 regulatory ankyrin repeat subunit B-like [Mercenaria mercenaria]|uniref:serine/threonine-protein phosphatase 6 regulatory ankyrin repeat subunit B-like n=1 Tax=Mercenaria mercenaria TaxID=6596 RepID=UPI00234EF977|nr:serine/threonine-protein phosphatase 6 regulatory ankyrin repeat subunit B-like [Mercenaria mercenaria]